MNLILLVSGRSEFYNKIYSESWSIHVCTMQFRHDCLCLCTLVYSFFLAINYPYRASQMGWMQLNFSKVLIFRHESRKHSEHLVQVSFFQSCGLSIDVKVGKTFLQKYLQPSSVHNKIPYQNHSFMHFIIFLFGSIHSVNLTRSQE